MRMAMSQKKPMPSAMKSPRHRCERQPKNRHTSSSHDVPEYFYDNANPLTKTEKRVDDNCSLPIMNTI